MPQGDRSWDVETDLLVVGAGAAGMTAALVGALEGLNVVLCEKSKMVGGTTATSAGTVWIPGSRQGQLAGTPDTVDAARTYLTAMLGEHATDERLDMFLKAGPVVLDYLEQKTNVRFAAPPIHPDYKQLPGAAIGGRALGAVPFDGRKLGDDFARIRPPRREFMVLGGMMVGKADIPALLAPFRNWTNFRHVIGLLTRHALDRISHKRGTRLIMGNALVARLFEGVRRAGVDLRFETCGACVRSSPVASMDPTWEVRKSVRRAKPVRRSKPTGCRSRRRGCSPSSWRPTPSGGWPRTVPWSRRTRRCMSRPCSRLSPPPRGCRRRRTACRCRVRGRRPRPQPEA
ncbi:FAD-dependent oxidoreductase [Bradyrhizobium sp. 23AC]